MIRKKLGQRIKEKRLQLGLSQEKFALSINMDRTYFASVEKGKRNISILNIEKIAKGLNISLSELFQRIGYTLASQFIQIISPPLKQFPAFIQI